MEDQPGNEQEDTSQATTTDHRLKNNGARQTSPPPLTDVSLALFVLLYLVSISR